MLRLAPRWKIAAVALAAFGSVTVADVAHAASCKAMKAELASLSGGKSARFRKAIRRQLKQLGRVDDLMGVHSCRTRRSATCATLERSRRDMKRNLRVLRGKTGTKAQRARLRRKIAKRCDEFRTDDRSMRARIAGRKPGKQKRVVKAVPRTRSKTGRTFATMCVRMCDGFAFPVSFSTKPHQFGYDARACASLCPGVQTRLYAAPTARGTVANARDVETGEPYPALSTAFRHRKVFDKACQCRFEGSAKLDYGTPVAKPERRSEAALRPARNVRIVGADYFASK